MKVIPFAVRKKEAVKKRNKFFDPMFDASPNQLRWTMTIKPQDFYFLTLTFIWPNKREIY